MLAMKLPVTLHNHENLSQKLQMPKTDFGEHHLLIFTCPARFRDGF